MYAWIVDYKGRIKYKFVDNKEYNIKSFSFICKKHKYKNKYEANKKINQFHRCPFCSKTSGAPYVFSKKIPSWRLNIEYAKPRDLFENSLEDFGVPEMSEEKWKEFYNQPHEVERMKQVKEAKEKAFSQAVEEALSQEKKE